MSAQGQSAVEYLLVFSVVLIILSTVTLGMMITPSSEAASDTLHLSQARSAADAISGAIDTVYANGRGAVKTVSFTMGSAWDLELDNTQNKLRITVAGNQVKDNLRYEIDNYHSLSNIPGGTYTVIVEWPEDVWVLENLDGSEIENKKIFVYIRPQGR